MHEYNKSAFTRYTVSITSVLAAFLLRLLLLPFLGDETPFITFFPAVAISALYGGLGPGLVSILLSALTAGCFIMSPPLSLSHTSRSDLMQIFIFVLMSGFIYWLSIQRKNSEENLRRKEHWFRSLIEHSADSVSVIDKDNNILYVSPASLAVEGYKPEELIGRNGIENTHPDDLTVIETTVRKLLDNPGKPIPVLWRRKHKNGKWIWLEGTAINLLNDPVVKGIVTNYRDVTERKRAEDALKNVSAQLEAVFNSMQGGVVVTDMAGNFILVNEAEAKICGFQSVEDMKKNLSYFAEIFELRHPDKELLPVEEWPLSKILRGESIRDWELLGKRLDTGQEWFFSYSGEPVFDAEGKQSLAVVITRDITVRKRTEEALTVSEGKLLQSQKMDAIGQLAGGVAHDFNNMLTVIIGYCNLLLLQLPANDSVRNYVNEILKAGERATSLTSQLLAFSRQQVLEPKIVNLNEVVKSIEKMLRRLIGEDIALTATLNPSISNVKVDPGQIEQAIVNLAVNARDSMPHGGKLTIETSDVELVNGDWQYEFEYKNGRYVNLTITDTGHGMTPETKSHIFEPFFTTKMKGKGTGLGLSTVYGIVKQSGGYITVYSEIGMGSVFKLYFPIVEDEATVTVSPEHRVIESGDETILLVEDNDEVRNIAKLILETNGYNVLETDRGHKAAEIYSTYEGAIHLVVTDVVMPEMSGRRLAEILREKHKAVKILFMSGYTDDAVLRHGIITEHEAFLHKPFSPAMLLEKVREVLEA